MTEEDEGIIMRGRRTKPAEETDGGDRGRNERIDGHSWWRRDGGPESIAWPAAAGGCCGAACGGPPPRKPQLISRPHFVAGRRANGFTPASSYCHVIDTYVKIQGGSCVSDVGFV